MTRSLKSRRRTPSSKRRLTRPRSALSHREYSLHRELVWARHPQCEACSYFLAEAQAKADADARQEARRAARRSAPPVRHNHVDDVMDGWEDDEHEHELDHDTFLEDEDTIAFYTRVGNDGADVPVFEANTADLAASSVVVTPRPRPSKTTGSVVSWMIPDDSGGSLDENETDDDDPLARTRPIPLADAEDLSAITPRRVHKPAMDDDADAVTPVRGAQRWEQEPSAFAVFLDP